MLFKFFQCQWLDNKKHDWTEQVKCDLEDFGIKLNMQEIEEKSVFSWKQFVKKKARAFEFKKLMKMKESKTNSKLEKLKYEKLEEQQYLKSLDVKKAKTVFIYRTRK